jgi:hypothetical protein
MVDKVLKNIQCGAQRCSQWVGCCLCQAWGARADCPDSFADLEDADDEEGDEAADARELAEAGQWEALSGVKGEGGGAEGHSVLVSYSLSGG